MPKAAMMTATLTATEAATATATELVQLGGHEGEGEWDGSVIRGANSICVKNTFSCCACFKYNTQPAKTTAAAATAAARCKLYYF